MSIPVRCPHCREAFQVADKFAESKIRCPKCKTGVIEVVAAAPNSLETAFAGDLMLKPIESPSDAATTGPPRKRQRSLLRNKKLRGWVGAIMLAAGLLGAAGYAWQLISQTNMAEIKLPPVSLDSLSGGSDFVPNAASDIGPPVKSEMISGTASEFTQINVTDRENVDPNGRGATRMKSTLHPFEVDFPSSQVIAFPTPKGDAYIYLHRPESGVVGAQYLLLQHSVDELAPLFYVIYVPKNPGESGEEGVRREIEKNKLRDDPAAFFEYKELEHEGYFAVDKRMSAQTPSEVKQYRASVRTIGHPTGRYVIGAHAGDWSQESLDRFVESFHFTDGASGPSGDAIPIPIAIKTYSAKPKRTNGAGAPDPAGDYILWEDIRVQ